MYRRKADSQLPAAADGRRSMSLRRAALRGSLVFGASTVLCRVLHSAAYMILARYLGPTEFGAMTLASIAVNVLALFPAMGLGTALLTENKDPQHVASAAFGAAIASGLLLWLISIVVSIVIFNTAGKEVAVLSGVLGASLAFRSLSAVGGALLDADLRFGQRAGSEVLGAGVFFGTSVTMGLLHFGALSIAAALVASSFSSALWVTLATRVVPTWSRSAWKQLAPTARIGAIVLAVNIAQWLFVSIDVVIIEKLLGRTEVGIYALAMYLGLLPSQAVGAISSRVALPLLVKARHHGTIKTDEFLDAVFVVSFLGAAAAAVFLSASEQLVRLAYGSQYVGAAAMLPVLAIYGYSKAVGGLAGPALFAAGRSMSALSAIAGQLVIATVISLLLVRTLAVNGVAVGFTIAVASGCAYSLFVGSRALGCGVWETAVVSIAPIAAAAGPILAVRMLTGAKHPFAELASSTLVLVTVGFRPTMRIMKSHRRFALDARPTP